MSSPRSRFLQRDEYATRNRDGFTLVELMVITILIGILATIAMSSLSGMRERTMVEATRAEMRNLLTAAEHYRAVNGVLPTSLDQLVDGNFHNSSDDIGYCRFSRDGAPPEDLLIEAAHRGSPVRLLARYPSAGVTMQTIHADTDCS